MASYRNTKTSRNLAASRRLKSDSDRRRGRERVQKCRNNGSLILTKQNIDANCAAFAVKNALASQSPHRNESSAVAVSVVNSQSYSDISSDNNSVREEQRQPQLTIYDEYSADALKLKLACNRP